MADESPALRAVGPDERRALRRPGPAVLSILLYAALFAGALWSLRAQSPIFRKASGAAPAPLARPKREARAVSRSALLSAAQLTPLARDEYFRQLSTECCTCGCDLRLSECLASDLGCTRSPERAETLLEQMP